LTGALLTDLAGALATTATFGFTATAAFFTGFTTLAAALALALFWGRLSFTRNENAAAPGEWLEQTPTSDVVESLESDVWSTDAQEQGALLTDEELCELNPSNPSKS
jgi:hypothetical protein